MITNIILMAGESSRFSSNGFDKPKYLLPLEDGVPMIHYVVDNLPDGYLITVGKMSNRRVSFGTLMELTLSRHHYFFWVDETSGPLESLIAARSLWVNAGELIVAYCDGFIRHGIDDLIEHWRKSNADSGGVLFQSEDPRFGYWNGRQVCPGDTRYLRAIAGIFYFSNGRKLEDLITECNDSSPAVGVPSVLNSLSHMVEVDPRRVVDLGTPEDYYTYMGGLKAPYRFASKSPYFGDTQ